MKNFIFFIGLFVILSYNAFSQERQNETREKLDFKIELKSDLLTEICGWSRIESSEGKIWEKSKPSTAYNYLVGRSREYSFYSLRMVELSINSKSIYVLSVWRPKFKDYEDSKFTKWEYDSLMLEGKHVDWFFFSESSLQRLKNVVNAADGKAHLMTEVKYFKTSSTDKSEDNEEIYIEDKELKNILIKGDVSILKWTNLCAGDSLFNINSQVLKSDTIVRFNLLSDVSHSSGVNFTLLPLTDSYFEITKSEFNRLFKFSPFISKEKSQKAKEYVSDGIAKDKLKDYDGAIAGYTKAIEINPEYAEAYYLRGLLKIKSGQKTDGCLDLQKAAGLGNKNANKRIKEYCQ